MSLRFLFICTHNRCRSILAEAITNKMAVDKITAASAGSRPAERVHPDCIKHLKERGYPTKNLQSKSWHDLKNFQATVIISLCDQAVSEPCPAWFGKQIQVHWGLADPSKISEPEDAVRKVFNNTIDIIEFRIKSLLELDLEGLNENQLGLYLQELAN